ncbi:unnamed protein product [Litomosoides sigmodontis]|uniref:Ground-like domain-containing protein n=1 Tax=Litomosoides sigmodontis TaxID=42156 RepID=A0A3P6TYH8_LITSI|nr:unnamed protein product [Litomosoides sigmodontis]
MVPHFSLLAIILSNSILSTALAGYASYQRPPPQPILRPPLCQPQPCKAPPPPPSCPSVYCPPPQPPAPCPPQLPPTPCPKPPTCPPRLPPMPCPPPPPPKPCPPPPPPKPCPPIYCPPPPPPPPCPKPPPPIPCPPPAKPCPPPPPPPLPCPTPYPCPPPPPQPYQHPPPPPKPCPPPQPPKPCPPTYCPPPPPPPPCPKPPPPTPCPRPPPSLMPPPPPPKPCPYHPPCPLPPPPPPCKSAEVCAKCMQQARGAIGPASANAIGSSYFVASNKAVAAKLRRRNRIKREKMNVAIGANACNSEDLMKIMEQNLSTNLASSKRLIQKFAEEKLKRDFNVICSDNSFTFITHATLYCQIVKFDVSCYAFSAG